MESIESIGSIESIEFNELIESIDSIHARETYMAKKHVILDEMGPRKIFLTIDRLKLNIHEFMLSPSQGLDI